MDSRHILIFVNSADSHASSVAHVIAGLGYKPLIFNTAKLPNGDGLSVDFDLEYPVIKIGDFHGGIDQIRSSWNRRFSKLFSMPRNLHPADETHVRNNSSGIINGVLQLIDDRFPVNPISAARNSSNKLMQLEVARRVGFRIPRTLVSNRFEDIRAFAETEGDICVKAYYPQGWKTDRGISQSVTARLELSTLGDSKTHQLFPHFYQEYIRKRFEYRVTMFGQFSATVRIASSSLEGAAAIDWRASPEYLNDLQVEYLPDSVMRAARKLLSALGLRFGILDIAETYEGEFIFFEVNEAGQWLWQELHCPECRILQPFCEYLINANDKFSWSSAQSISEYDASEVIKTLENHSGDIDLDDYPDEIVHVTDERNII